LTYEYKCPKCGVIEVSHKIGENIKKCPKCGAEVTKVFGTPYTVMKGFSGRWG